MLESSHCNQVTYVCRKKNQTMSYELAVNIVKGVLLCTAVESSWYLGSFVSYVIENNI